MIVDWMVYAVAVSALLGLAALAAERSLRLAGRPGRWVWLAALAVSVLVPVLEWLLPGSVTASFPALAPAVIPLPAVGAGVTEAVSAGASVSLGTLAFATWGAVSVALLLYTTLGALVLGRRRATWRPSEVEGVPVLVSKDAGPAALGVLRGAVVVPEWALALEPERRRMLVRHEAEHLRVGDPALQLAGLLLAVAFPWNPVVWWLLARLRLAIEVDCDARVLRAEHDARAYGTLLLEMGRHRSGLRLAVVSLAEPASMLERRIRMIGRPLARNLWKAGALAAVAGVAVVLACEAPSPTADDVTVEPGSTVGMSATRIRVEPAEPGPGCPAAIYLDGVLVEDAKMLEGLDPARIRRVEVLGQARAVIEGNESLSLDPGCGTILITTADAAVESTEVVAWKAGQSVPDAADPIDGPHFTPFTTRPELLNGSEVAAALQEAYPPLLRDAGIGGKVDVWFYIDERGLVTKVQISRSSGRDELDEAALEVADVFRFRPARNGDEVTSVWVSIPIIFQTGDAVEGG